MGKLAFTHFTHQLEFRQGYGRLGKKCHKSWHMHVGHKIQLYSSTSVPCRREYLRAGGGISKVIILAQENSDLRIQEAPALPVILTTLSKTLEVFRV